MKLLKRLIRVINISYVLYALAIVALYYALTTSVIVDPLIAFLFAGIVPGTDVVLAPETLFMILTDVFGLTVVALLVGWLVRRHLMSGAEPEPQLELERTVSKPVRQLLAKAAIRPAASKPIKAPKTVKSSQVDLLAHYVGTVLATAGLLALSAGLTAAKYGIIVLTVISKILIYIIGMVLITTQFLLAAMVAGAAQIGRLLLRGGAVFVRYATWTLVFIIVVLGVSIDLAISLGKYLWRAASPGLRRFDSWLEVTLGKLLDKARGRYKHFELLQVFRLVIKDGITSLRRLFIK